jgi:hypothetical protein
MQTRNAKFTILYFYVWIENIKKELKHNQVAFENIASLTFNPLPNFDLLYEVVTILRRK